jgi:hypothetical protein
MIKKFNDFILEKNIYDPDQWFDYDKIVSALSKGPADIRRTINILKPEEHWVDETNQFEKMTRISAQQWAFIFHPKY